MHINAPSGRHSRFRGSGVTADTLAPMSLTNRAQAAVIFQRFDNTVR